MHTDWTEHLSEDSEAASSRHLCAGRILRGTPTFREMSADSLNKLVTPARPRTLQAGDHLFRPGDSYQGKVYILLEGEITMHRPSGRIDNLRPGDFIGLANYLDNNDYTTTAIAVTRSTVLELDADSLHRLERQLPDLFNALNRIIAAKLRDRSITSGALAQPVTRVMKSPVVSCSPDASLQQVLTMMQARKIGCMVVKDEKERLLGVLTFSGLARAALLDGASATDSIMQAVCETPRLVDPDTPLWEAEELMQRYTAKYLIVVEAQTAIGILSQTDILRSLIFRPSTLSNRIKHSTSLKQLADHSGELADVADDARETNHRPSAAVRLLSETHLMIQRRAIELTLDWMQNKGYGPAPVDYALIIMGSGGRKEMLLNPDQDNGLIIDDPPPGEMDDVNEWFGRFSKRVNRNLDKVGYMLCPGEVMACNPAYRKTLSQWKRQITHIAGKPTDKAARWANVMLDFDTLYGNDLLTSELRRHALAEFQRHPRLLKIMADHDAEGRPAIGLFNRLITTRDNHGEWIDIKRNGLRIITDAARIFALQNGVAVQNTSDRLKSLARIGKLSDDFVDTVHEAYEELLDLLLQHQIAQARSGDALNKLIDPERLTPRSRGTLRMAMRAVKRFQARLMDDYASEIF